VSFTPEVTSRRNAKAALLAGVPLVRDVGVAPGLSHILSAGAEKQLGGLSSLTIYVGGLPAKPPAAPFRHAVYFNALDLLSEYLRPARMRRAGRRKAPDPLDPQETRQLHDADLGQLEAFPSDGLRSLLSSYPRCREMVELTLRWPGHLRAMRRLSSAGKLDGSPDTDSPLRRTAGSLARHFPGDRIPDVLLMEVHASYLGKRRAYRVVDRARGGITGMSRTTAFTATAALHALARGMFSTPGEHPPEVLGRDGRVRDLILKDLRARGISIGHRPKLEPLRK
jgi:saccharopine dehydrogenase-like NADP-dependent oxidoreductase